MTTPILFRIRAGNLNLLQKALNDSNKKAVKLGVPVATMTVLGSEMVEIVTKGKATGKFRKVISVEVTGGVPKLAGWELVGLLHHITTDEAGKDITVMHTMPNKTIPVMFHNQSNVCEHCHVNRRRNTTFVLANVDGRNTQVGSSCLADFLGFNADPMALARFAEQFAMLEAKMKEEDDKEPVARTGGKLDFYGTQEFLSYVAATIRTHGWMSRSKARASYPNPIPTADIAMHKLARDSSEVEIPSPTYPGPDMDKYNAANRVEVTDADRSEAAKVSNFMAVYFDDQDDSALGDYLSNLRIAMYQATINYRLSGIVASLFAAYNRIQKDAERMVAAKAEMEKSLANPTVAPGYFGTVGARTKFQARVTTVKGLENSTMVKMETVEGNKLTWFCTGGCNFVEGEIYSLIGTIKAHQEYKGIKGTIVNRVAVAA